MYLSKVSNWNNCVGNFRLGLPTWFTAIICDNNVRHLHCVNLGFERSAIRATRIPAISVKSVTCVGDSVESNSLHTRKNLFETAQCMCVCVCAAINKSCCESSTPPPSSFNCKIRISWEEGEASKRLNACCVDKYKCNFFFRAISAVMTLYE